MKALRFHHFGGPEVISLEDVPEPEARDDEVLVRVKAWGLNFADTERRRGLYLASALPETLGFEGAGVVEGTGERVAFIAPRAHAELCVVPRSKLIHLPDEFDFVRGAAFPVQWLTAWHVLHTVGRVRRGETVLIHGAAGGVGQAAVQLAKAAGARVIATVSRDAKQSVVKSLGADEVHTRSAELEHGEELARVVGHVAFDDERISAQYRQRDEREHFGVVARAALLVGDFGVRDAPA